jgi:hypothetical protein
MKNLFQSSNPTLDAFLNRDLDDYPALVACRAEGTGINFEYESVQTLDDIDEYDVQVLGIQIPIGQLRVGNRFDNEFTLVSESDFDDAVLKLAAQLLKSHKHDAHRSPDWKSNMESSIRLLKRKIKNRNN